MSPAIITAPEQPEVLREERFADFGRLANSAERSRYLSAYPDLVVPSVVAILAERVSKRIQTSRREAMSLADCALFIARKLHDTGSTALALRAKANVLHASGRNKAAINYHNRARALFIKAGDPTQVARTLSASIQPLILLGEYDRAYAAAAEASAIFKQEGNDWRLARVELNTGNIFDRQDRFQKALDCYERAYHHLLPYQDRDPEAMAVVLHNMAGCLVLLNDFHRAVATYEQARTFAASNGMPLLVSQADYNLAWLYYLRGEYSRAISMLLTTRDACEHNGDRYHFGLCHLDLSEIYLELNMSREAGEAAVVAHQSFHSLGMRYDEGKALANLGIALGHLGRGVEALEAFGRSRAIFLRERNRPWCAQLDLYQAVALYDQHRDAESRQLATAALKTFLVSALLNKVVLCHVLLARLHTRGNRLPFALRECTRALKCLKKFESPALSCQAHALMARVQQALDRPARAYDSYLRAKTFLEQLRNSIRGEELKISFMRDRVEIYEGLVDLCIRRTAGSPGEAFNYIEQAKSRSLFDMLAGPERILSQPSDGESEAARRIREVRQELNWYYHRTEIEQLSTGEHAEERLQTLRMECRQRERELLRVLREHAPETRESDVPSLDSSLSVDEIQQALHPRATILEYFQVRDQLVAVIIARDSVELVALGQVSVIEGLMSRLRFQMAKLRLGAEYVNAFEDALLQTTQSHLWELHQELIAPLRARLRTPHLIIVPQGCLHHLPFHALFDGDNYLVDNFTISYAPSASVYSICDKRSGTDEGRALILGIPDPTIPLVEAEVAAVSQILPNADLVVGAGATAKILAEQGSRCRFIHIATHGYFREDQPMFSGVRLADSYLSLYDLYRLQLPVELVTLSGCSTGLNVVSAGDEILGLVRGLICAGVQSSVLTLWDVQDRTTAEFMQTFYERLMGGRNKAEAVRDAALRLRKSHRHPYYWAPFVLVGKVFEDRGHS